MQDALECRVPLSPTLHTGRSRRISKGNHPNLRAHEPSSEYRRQRACGGHSPSFSGTLKPAKRQQGQIGGGNHDAMRCDHPTSLGETRMDHRSRQRILNQTLPSAEAHNPKSEHTNRRGGLFCARVRRSEVYYLQGSDNVDKYSKTVHPAERTRVQGKGSESGLGGGVVTF